MSEQFTPTIESDPERIKALSEMIKKKISDGPDPAFESCIKDHDSLVISGELGFQKNIHTKYSEVYNFLTSETKYFKNPSWEVEGGGISAELVEPIGDITQVIICIEKDQ